jgi:hypothetical protein
VSISTAPPLSGVIDENPDDLLLSLSPNYHGNLPNPGAAVPPHGHESTIDREPAVVPSSINPIHDFSIKKQFREALRFLISPEIAHSFFKIAPELYHNQFQEILKNAKIEGKPLNFFNKYRNSSYLFQISP